MFTHRCLSVRGAVVAAALAAAVLSARCSTSSTSSTEPGGGRCSPTLSPPSAAVGISGGPVGFSFTTTPDCEWTPKVTTGATWLVDLAPVSGQGSGQVSLRATANTGPERTGTVAIFGRTFTVTQASGCTYGISPVSQQLGSPGGPGTVAVTSEAGCAWTATSNASFVSVTEGAAGTGPGMVTLNTQANVGPERSGTVTIGGRVFTVTQASGCTFSLSPASRTFTGGGGSDSVSVTTAPGCTWSAQVAADSLAWMAITAGGTGVGNGAVQYIVAPIFFGSRTGSITIAGQTFTVIQQ